MYKLIHICHQRRYSHTAIYFHGNKHGVDQAAFQELPQQTTHSGKGIRVFYGNKSIHGCLS